MKTAQDSPLIYNLFPRLVGSFDNWLPHARRARDMGFNWLYINPIQYAGFSGSLYAIKDYYRLNPLFVPQECKQSEEHLRRVLDEIRGLGLRIIFDLVINHTSKDCDLIKAHPTWYLHDEKGEVISPFAIDPADARIKTVWGDLAEVDNAESADRAALWQYWTEFTLHLLDLGVDGFRGDAAYKVPAALWKKIITATRQKKSDAVFFGETLGCRLEEMRELESAGFDYFFNSSKYWQFDAPWCIEQNSEFGSIAPSISFPESHDTTRLFADTNGNLAVQKQRYLFSACFSAGVLMPLGYEYGFRTRCNVVHTMPTDYEQPAAIDLTSFIREVNRLKRSQPILASEGKWKVLSSLHQPTIVLKKSSLKNGPEALVLVINKDWHHPQTAVLPDFSNHLPPSSQMIFPSRDNEKPTSNKPANLLLNPAEVVLIV